MRAWLLIIGIALGVAASALWQARHTEHEQGAADVSAAGHQQAASARDENTDAADAARVHLDADARALADIETAPAQATQLEVEQYTPGRVLDGGELLAALRERRAAREAMHAQQDLLATQRARLERLRGFAARGEITVARELNALELSVRREADVAATRAAQMAASDAQLRARWGATLAGADGLDARLAAGDAQLVEFAAPAQPRQVHVARDDQRAAALTGEVLGAAPAALGATPTSTWVALVVDTSLRVGMRVGVWVPAGAAIGGVLVPAQAIVWHGGAQWYYVEIAPGEFERRRLGASHRHALGIVVSDGLRAGSAVVVRGAQALLAEQLRQHIPSEDDD
ncbi:MAG: hypothetical protein IT492_18855 [Gammaproteobacteria bacterium]|nr:hypothetical protein [Gammaproteobacteria bacterium]